MIYTKTDEKIRVEAGTYTLEVTAENIAVILAGERVALLRPGSAVNVLKADGEIGEDKAEGALTCSFADKRDADGSYVFTWTGKSANWEKKEYVVLAKENCFEYFVRVTGKGDVDSVKYFIGDCGDWLCGSEYDFDTGYMPIPTVNGASQCEFSAQCSYDEFSYLTVPPMFCYTFDIRGMIPKLAFGLVADRGEHNFTKFAYQTRRENSLARFWLWTDQSGHTRVDGTWQTPSVIVYGADSRSDSLKYYSDYYFATGRADAKDPFERKPRFWYGPMACGWIEQTAYRIKANIARADCDMAYQPTYDHMLSELRRRDLHPQIIIIDDKWQTGYGSAVVNTEKWPDLRGWIDATLRDYNCRTMLWYKLWDREELPDDMTMDNGQGGRCVDPSNPKYREYLRETMHRLLSSDEGCCNAYGLKLDYAFTQPVGKDAKSYSGKFGVELFLDYIALIHDCAKAAKPEAIISASPCHPLFTNYVDHARLHDYYPDLRRCYEEFTFRREIYDIAMPGVLFDTDGSAYNTRRDTMRYMRLAPKIGIPDLYCITEFPSLTLSDDDWESVADIWREYGELIDRTVGKE